MKATFLALPLLATLPVFAQTASPRAAHGPVPALRAPAPACSAHPELSAKIPALLPGAACPRPLYTITSVPSVKLEYVSPLENSAAVRETLGLEATSFSLDYVDVVYGNGDFAQPHKYYSIHYTGYLADGTKFDSSLDRGEPITIKYGEHNVIAGWDTGFDGMRVGGKRRLFIPYQLAYGPNGRPPTIPAKSELIFDVELVSQSDTAPTPAPRPAPAPAPQASPAGATAPPPVSSQTPAATQGAKPKQ